MAGQCDNVTESRFLYAYANHLISTEDDPMTRNVGTVDKTIRLIAGLGLGAWVLFGAGLGSTLSGVGLGVSVILIATALINFCPLFKILGISSAKGQ